MLELTFDRLNEVDKVLYEQVAVNPAFENLLILEKEFYHNQLKQCWRQQNETDASFCRRIELIQQKIAFLQEFTALHAKISTLIGVYHE